MHIVADTNTIVSGLLWHGKPLQSVQIEPVILDDPDDDEVLACAVAAHAQVIVSGDSHLLGLKRYKHIRILSPDRFLKKIRRHTP
jgi:predicted nucleic acid-binding protein